MDNFFVHKINQENKTYIIHFKDIIYWTIVDLNNGNLYCPNTIANGPNIALLNDEGLNIYNKWLTYKNK